MTGLKYNAPPFHNYKLYNYVLYNDRFEIQRPTLPKLQTLQLRTV